jgi:hypothetical protein
MLSGFLRLEVVAAARGIVSNVASVLVSICQTSLEDARSSQLSTLVLGIKLCSFIFIFRPPALPSIFGCEF